jgi:homopolymeric O-antigen transport system permease protein
VSQTELPVRDAAIGVDAQRSAERAFRGNQVTSISPMTRWPRLDVPELWRYRELLGTFVWRDIKVRYKQTTVGVAWALLVPIFTAVVYIVVFGRFAKFPRGQLAYPVLVLSGLLPMQYFTSSLSSAAASVVSNGPLVTKVYFPRVLLPMAAVLVPAVDFLLSMVVLVGVMAWYSSWPAGPIAVLAPVFLLLALVAALGLGLFLSALNVRYRDVAYAIPVFLQVLPLLSAVPYALDQIPTKWQWILSVNPMTAAISGWRWTLLGGAAPNPTRTAIGVAVALTLFVGGLAFFRSTEPRFADTI